MKCSERALCIYQSQSIIKPNEVIGTRAPLGSCVAVTVSLCPSYFDLNMSTCRLVLSLVSNSRCQGEVQMRWVERS